jgi:molecular chaperone Hsp33
MTLDRGPDFERTQGITPIEGESLSLAAEHYFQQSEQIPTRVRLAVGSVVTDEGVGWRAGGALIQLIAGDEARGSTEEAWDRSRALFQTLADDELLDTTITPEVLLFRLFHEDGVRLEDALALVAQCRCSRERIAGVLTSFDPAERADMVEADGKIRVTCEYCATVYELAPEEIAAG